MNLRQMRAFHATISKGSVSKAADALGLTQPAVSKLIQSLEENVGYKLFERIKRQILPTSNAKYLFHEVDDVIAHLDRLDGLFKLGQKHKKNRVQIGSVAGPANFLIPEVLGKFTTKVEGFSTVLTTRSSKVICDRVANKTLDIGIVDVFNASPSYEFTPIPLTCLCAIPSSDPLSQKPFLVPSDVDGQPFIGLSRGHSSYEKINQVFQQANAIYNVKHEIYVHLPAIAMVRAGLGYAFIDLINIWSCEKYFDDIGVVFKPFKPNIQEDMAILTPIDHPQSQFVIDIIKHLKSTILDIERNYIG